MSISIDIPSTSDGDVLNEKHSLNNETQASGISIDPPKEKDSTEYTGTQKEQLRMITSGIRPEGMSFSLFRKLRTMMNVQAKSKLKGKFEHISNFRDETTGERFGVNYKKESTNG